MIRKMLRKREDKEYECARLLELYREIASALDDIFPELPMLTAAKDSPFVPMRRLSTRIFGIFMLIGLLLYGLDLLVPECGLLVAPSVASGIFSLYSAWKVSRLHESGGEIYLPLDAWKASEIVLEHLRLVLEKIKELEEARTRDDEWIRKFKKVFDEAGVEKNGGAFSIEYVSWKKTCRIRVHFFGAGIGGTGHEWFFGPNEESFESFSRWMNLMKEGKYYFILPRKVSNSENVLDDDEFGDGTSVRRT